MKLDKTVLQIESLQLAVCRGKESIPILRDISFSLSEGQRLGIVGRSGAGKSMTMYAITDLLPSPDMRAEGRIAFEDGKNILDMKPAQRRHHCSAHAAIVLQDSVNALNPYERIYAQLEETIRFHNGGTGAQVQEHIRRIMDTVGLPSDRETLRKYPHQFSGGMRQRIAIALALESRARILIADEPTTSLDVINQKRFLIFLKEICGSRRLSLIYISHNLALIHDLCEDVLIMENGTIVERGKTKEVFAAPKSRCARELAEGARRLAEGAGRPAEGAGRPAEGARRLAEGAGRPAGRPTGSDYEG